MKAEYNSTIYAYESNTVEILNIIAEGFEVATEAEEPAELNASNAVKDTVSSEENSKVKATVKINKVAQRIRELIKKIGEILSALKLKMQNRLRTLLETDKGFYKLYYKRKSMIKPYKNVRVISYKYNNAAIEQPMYKVFGEILLCLDKLRAVEGTTNMNQRISAILESGNGKIIETLLEPYVKSSEIPVRTIPDFIKYLVQQFRGEKQELVYSDTQLGAIEANALSTKDISDKCNKYLKDAQSAYDKIRTLEYQIGKSASDEKVISLISANAAKASILYNAYSALVSALYELKVEESLNYRIILKKFYQF